MAVIFAARSGHPQQLTQLRNIARELVLHILGEPDFGLRLGSRLHGLTNCQRLDRAMFVKQADLAAVTGKGGKQL